MTKPMRSVSPVIRSRRRLSDNALGVLIGLAIALPVGGGMWVMAALPDQSIAAPSPVSPPSRAPLITVVTTTPDAPEPARTVPRRPPPEPVPVKVLPRAPLPTTEAPPPSTTEPPPTSTAETTSPTTTTDGPTSTTTPAQDSSAPETPELLPEVDLELDVTVE